MMQNNKMNNEETSCSPSGTIYSTTLYTYTDFYPSETFYDCVNISKFDKSTPKFVTMN